MAYYKEIVTKAVIGKGKKTFKTQEEVNIDTNINNVLGCWVINHKFNGTLKEDTVIVNGTFDVNIWYSYDNNSKTNVVIKKFDYQEPMKVKIKENASLDSNSEIIIHSLNQPSVSDVELENGIIKLYILKELGVEIIGNAKMRVSVEDEMDDYEEIIDDDIDINEEYL